MAVIRCARCEWMVDDDWHTCRPHALLEQHDLACPSCLETLDEELLDECLADAGDLVADYAAYVDRFIDKHEGTRCPLSMLRWAKEKL